MENEPRPQRINNITAGFMIAVAIVFDLISIIPFINILVDIVAWLVFGFWFALLGVGFINPRRFAVMATSFIVGAIPVVSTLPELTVAIIVTILMVKSEDKLGIKLPGSPAKPSVRASVKPTK